MMMQLLFLFLLASGIAVCCTVGSFLAKKKRRQEIIKNFGNAPNAPFKRTARADYWDACHKASPSPADVDALTWNDLSMEEVYDRINACQTTVGQDYLYAMLHRPHIGAAEGDETKDTLARRERLMEALSDETLRMEVQMLLAKLGKRMASALPMVLFHPDSMLLSAPWRFPLFALLPLLCIPLFFVSPLLAMLWLMGAMGHNVALYLRVQKQLSGRLETLSYLMLILRCGRQLCHSKTVSAQCPMFTALLQDALLPAKKMNVSTALLTVSPQSDAEIFVQMSGMLTLLPLIQYCKCARVLQGATEQMRLLYALLGELDSAISVLSYRKSLTLFTPPIFETAESPLCLKIVGLVHPLIPPESTVPNDAEIAHSWLLTGSNASGKSTFIKAVAINCILAQTVQTCTAQSYRMTRAPVVTSMAVEDNVVDGESYFIAEIKSMQRIVFLADSGVRLYCFIDEILKGTNTTERIAASYAVLCHLRAGPCLCLAATHDGELTVLLGETYCNCHFSEQFDAHGISFDYKLKPGPSTTRNAIRLLEYYGFPRDIIETANARAK